MQIETIADSGGGRSLVAGANPPRRHGRGQDRTAPPQRGKRPVYQPHHPAQPSGVNRWIN